LRTARREIARLAIALNFVALKVLPRRASSFLPIDNNKTTQPMEQQWQLPTYGTKKLAQNSVMSKKERENGGFIW